MHTQSFFTGERRLRGEICDCGVESLAPILCRNSLHSAQRGGASARPRVTKILYLNNSISLLFYDNSGKRSLGLHHPYTVPGTWFFHPLNAWLFLRAEGEALKHAESGIRRHWIQEAK